MQGSINFDGTLSGSIAGGGGGGGSEVSITPVLTEGTKIADYSIDGNTGELYAPGAGDTVDVTPTLNAGDKVADIEVNGVNKALYSQSYSYANDLHDANSETIGGLQMGSDITPIKVKSISYLDQSGADSETVGVLSVGDTDYNIKQKKSNVINYSTTEQGTGKKWIDGRSIYQKTFVKQITLTTGNRTWYEILSSAELTEINCDTILNYDNSYVNINDEIYNFNYSSVFGNVGAMIGVYQNKSLNKVEVCISSMDTGTFDIIITIQYIKAV